MQYRHRQQYAAVLAKRQQLRSREAFSEPDEAGSKVAILVSFMAELVVNEELDGRASFERQTERIMNHYEARGRNPEPIMGATEEDFAHVLADVSIPTVVVAGFGNISAIAVPLPREGGQAFRFGYLDWLHLAGIATHLKQGKTLALQCGGYYREFNPPLAVGFQDTYRNIHAIAGKARYAADEWESEIAPVTTADELSYEQVHELFPMQKKPAILPHAAFVALRGVHEHIRNPALPRPEKIPYPDEMRQFLKVQLPESD